MSKLWVPPVVEKRLREESARREQAALRTLSTEHRFKWKREFDAQLDRVVPGMVLAWCPEPAPLDAVAQGALPGRWHVMWPAYNGGPLVNLLPLVRDWGTGDARLGGEGDYAEPGSWVFDKLAEADMWNDRAMRDRRRIQREAEEAKRRRKEIEDAEFDLETFEHWKAVSRTQISMNRDTAWGQNARGASIARAERKRREKAS